jgi:hypothetical protein
MGLVESIALKRLANKAEPNSTPKIILHDAI